MQCYCRLFNKFFETLLPIAVLIESAEGSFTNEQLVAKVLQVRLFFLCAGKRFMPCSFMSGVLTARLRDVWRQIRVVDFLW